MESVIQDDLSKRKIKLVCFGCARSGVATTCNHFYDSNGSLVSPVSMKIIAIGSLSDEERDSSTLRKIVGTLKLGMHQSLSDISITSVAVGRIESNKVMGLGVDKIAELLSICNQINNLSVVEVSDKKNGKAVVNYGEPKLARRKQQSIDKQMQKTNKRLVRNYQHRNSKHCKPWR